MDLEAKGEDGEPLIPAHSHVLPGAKGGESILRRSYSHTDRMDRVRGKFDAGLPFVCSRRAPRRQFVPMQRHMAGNGALNEYIWHTRNAIFACPPGIEEGGWVGEGLFDGGGRAGAKLGVPLQCPNRFGKREGRR